MSKPESKCMHINFAVQANVARIFDRPEDEARSFELRADSYTVDLTLECAECGKKFMFFGAPIGLDPSQPTMSVDQLELRIPVCPEGEAPTLLGPGFLIKKGDGHVMAKTGTDQLMSDLGIGKGQFAHGKHGKRKLPPGVN